MKGKAKVLVPLAEGCEELEAVTIIDVLRRGGVAVVAAGLADGPVRASRGTVIVPDATLDEVLSQQFDMVVLPGGMPGMENLRRDGRVAALLQSMASGGKYTAAICASPVVLAEAGVLEGKRATGYPGFLEKVRGGGFEISEDGVVRDDRVITSKGPGTAMDFALELLELLCGPDKRGEVEKGLQRT